MPDQRRTSDDTASAAPEWPLAVIFDVDGTLVDTNEAHVDAWLAAFRDLGYDVSRDQVAPEVGKGGDNLVPSIIGKDGDKRDGDALRKAHDRHFFATTERVHFPVFPGARELIAELRRRGIRTALATSSGKESLDRTFRSCGVDFRELVNVQSNKDDADRSKPAPDIVVAAVGKLGVAPDACVMIGDTTHDGAACRRAGVPFVGVLSGGDTADDLVSVGARGVWQDTAAILANLDDVLAPAPRASEGQRR